jgi:8-oxoguanine deaminase
MRILLQGLDHIATFDDDQTELEGADILIDGPRIDAVGKDLAANGVDRVIDCRGLVALPGLINAHQHLFQASIRTLPELERSGMPRFLQAQNQVSLERWKAGLLGADQMRDIARAALTEAVLGGQTTVADQHLFFPGDQPEAYVEATIEAAADVGVRLHACRGTVTFGRAQGGMVDDVITEDLADIVRHMEELIEQYHDPDPFAMVRVALAPSGLVSDVLEVFDALAALAERHEGVRLHTHLHHQLDDLLAQKIYGKSPWKLLQEHGFANDKLWVAHSVTMPPEEIAEYVDAGVSVAYIPAADLKLGWGLAPVRRWLDAGVPVGAGTTGSMTNDGGNLLGDLRVGILAQRANTTQDPEQWLSSRELLQMATRGSAACLGRDDIGALAPGMGADIACWDFTGVDRIGINDPVAALLFTGLSQAAELVVANGEVLVEGGRPTRVDLDETIARARAVIPAVRTAEAPHEPAPSAVRQLRADRAAARRTVMANPLRLRTLGYGCC